MAPGDVLGRRFGFFDIPTLNDAGHVVFMSIFGGLDHGYWTDRSGAIEAIAIVDNPAPVEPNVNFYSLNTPQSNWLATPPFNAASQAAFFAQLTGQVNPPGSNQAVFSESGSTLHPVARTQYDAPGFDPPRRFYAFGDTDSVGPVLNDNGRTAFKGSVSPPSATGLWSDVSGSLDLVARTGSPAPGMDAGVQFSGWFSEPYINNAGQIAFRTNVSGPGVSSSNDSGVWSMGPGGNMLLVREGSQVLSLPEEVLVGETTTPPTISGSGRVAFTSRLTGPSINQNNDTALWASNDFGLQLLAWEGSHAPGTEEGVVFGEAGYGLPFSAIASNAGDEFAFELYLRGPGVTGANNYGLWLARSNGEIHKVLREGDLFEVRPGEFRTVSTFYMITMSGGQDGRPRGLNDDGEMVIWAEFTDDSEGVFVVRIPEPAALPAVILVCLLALRRRRG